MNPPYKLIFVKDGKRREFKGVDATSIISSWPYTNLAFHNLQSGGWIEADGGRYTLEVIPENV